MIIPKFYTARQLTFLFLILSSHFVFAQSLTISGTVTTQGHGVLPGVTIMATSGGDTQGAYSANDGSYSIVVSTKGDTVQLKAIMLEYQDQIQSLILNGKTTLQLDIVMKAVPLTMDETVITASRSFEQKQSDVTVSVEVMRPEAIDLQGAASVDNVLTQIPGVDNIGGQINIRGSSGYAFGIGSRVMVMMDGLPLLSGDAAFPELSLIPVDNIAQIEVVKGASSVLYGSGALGGVINVLMQNPGEKPRTSIRFRGGRYLDPKNKDLKWGDPTYDASMHIFHSRKIGDFDLTLQTDLIKNQGYYEGRDKEEYRAIMLTRFRPQSIKGLNIGLNIAGRIDSSANGLYWAGYYLDTLQNVEGQDSIVGGGLRFDKSAGSYRRQYNTRLSLDPYVKYLTPKGDLFWYRGRFLANKNNNNTGQSAKNSVFYNDFLYQTTLAKKINWVTGFTYKTSSANADSLYQGSKTGSEMGLYSQMDAKFGRLNASFGARLESARIDTIPRETLPVFRLGLNYRVWAGGNIRASYGQAFRAPSVAERYTNTAGGGLLIRPNPDLESEVGFGAEFAFRQGFKLENPNFSIVGYADVAAFIQKYDNMVEFGIKDVEFDFTQNPPLVPVFTSANISDAQITGIEFTLNSQMAWKDFFINIHGGITLLDPQNLNPVDSDKQFDFSNFDHFTLQEVIDFIDEIQDSTFQDNPATLKYRSKSSIRASVTLGYKKLSLSSNFRHRSAMTAIDQFFYVVIRDLNDFNTKVNPDGDTTVDFILGYEINKHHKISLHLDNAFNEEFMITPGYLAPQRKLTLQYIARF